MLGVQEVQAARDIERDAAAAPPPAERVRCAAAVRAALQRAEQVAALQQFAFMCHVNHHNRLHGLQNSLQMTRIYCHRHYPNSTSNFACAPLINTMMSISNSPRKGNQSSTINPLHLRAKHTPMYSIMSMGGWVSRQAP